MKEIKINKKSLHYRLVDCYTTYYEHNLDNFCDYCRAVMVGILAVILCIIGGAVLSYLMVVQPLMCIFTWFDPVFYEGNHSLNAGIILWAIVIAVVVLVVGNDVWENRHTYFNIKQKEKIDNDDSFIYNWYILVKDKICFKIKFTE